jgi:predicted RNA binding protein YcfA (HicA-like mRNA interferase family)
MPRITPIPWKRLECVFLLSGFTFSHQTGAHRIYRKEGLSRPVVIPVHSKPLAPFVIETNLRTGGIDREKYFELLKEC